MTCNCFESLNISLSKKVKKTRYIQWLSSDIKQQGDILWTMGPFYNYPAIFAVQHFEEKPPQSHSLQILSLAWINKAQLKESWKIKKNRYLKLV